jgi:hypothetical protein
VVPRQPSWAAKVQKLTGQSSLPGRGVCRARVKECRGNARTAAVGVLSAAMSIASDRQIFFNSPWPFLQCIGTLQPLGATFPVPILGEQVMRLSSSFAASSAVAILSTALLSGPAVSQTATGPATLPSVTVDAPKQVARPSAPTQRANTGGSRRTISTGPSTAQTPSVEPNSVQGRIAKLERAASSCNGGCQTSFKTGNAPWVGCSFGAGESAGVGPYSLTCTDTLTYKTYLDCTSTKVFLSWTVREARWHCASLLAGGKLSHEKVAQIMQAAR